eukprot:7936025-Pyramimonas_sp.AAC.1
MALGVGACLSNEEAVQGKMLSSPPVGCTVVGDVLVGASVSARSYATCYQPAATLCQRMSFVTEGPSNAP